MADVILQISNDPLVEIEFFGPGAATAIATANQAAESASSDAALAEAWATGTEPGGAGTKSAREWSDEAQSWSPSIQAPVRAVNADAGNGAFLIDDEDSRTAFALDGAGNALGSNYIRSAFEAAGIDYTQAAVNAMEGHGLVFAKADNEGLMIGGQSLGVGSLATGALTTTQPYANVELNATRTAFVPLVEGGANGVGGAYERPMSAMANAAKKALIAAIPPWVSYDPDFVVHNMAASNTALSGLVKGTAPYNSGIDDVTASKALYDAAGETYAERVLVWIHGENDNTQNPPTARGDYETGLLGLHDDWNTDVAAITSQSERIPLFIQQLGPGSSSDTTVAPTGQFPSAWAQLDAAENGNEVYVTGVGYACLYANDGLHYQNYGSRTAAEYQAKALHRYYVERKDPSIVRPLSLELIAPRAVEITFFVPVPPLRFDLEKCFVAPNYGFEVYDGATRLTISNVYLSAHNKVVIETTTDMAAGHTVQYASRLPTNSVGAGPYRGGRGNLFDSDRTLSMYPGPDGQRYTLPAPCAVFNKAIPA